MSTYTDRKEFKVSELIAELQKFLQEHGDLTVVSEEYGSYGIMTPHTVKKEDDLCVLDGY